MKYIIIILLSLLVLQNIFSQNVGIGTETPHNAAKLEVNSTNSGILIPRLTTAQKLAIPSPPNGLLVFDNQLNSFQYYTGSGWADFSNSKEIIDLDGDTKIQVEATPDDDMIQFTAEGTTILTVSKNNLSINTPSKSTYIGENTGVQDQTTNAKYHVIVGNNAGNSLSGGYSNTYVGAFAGNANVAGTGNVSLGTQAGHFNKGSENTLVGRLAGYSNNNGNGNTMVGHYAGGLTHGSQNVFIGKSAGRQNVGNGNIFIGSNAGETTFNSASNSLIIHNSNTSTPLIYGEFDNHKLEIDAWTKINRRFDVDSNSIQLNYMNDYPNAGLKFAAATVPSYSMVMENSSALFKKLKLQNHLFASTFDVMTWDGRKVGIGTTEPQCTLSVEALAHTSHVMSIENTSTNSESKGLEIKLNRSITGKDNNFITFKDNNSTAGRIEGFNGTADFTTIPNIDFSDYFNLTYIENFMFNEGTLPQINTLGSLPELSFNPSAIDITPPSLSGGTVTFSVSTMANCAISAGTNCSNPLSATPINFDEGNFDIDNNLFILDQGTLPNITPGSLPSFDFDLFFEPQVLAGAFEDLKDMMCWALENGERSLVTANPYDLVFQTNVNYLDKLAECKTGGVTYGSKGADYAEYLLKTNPEEDIRSGQIVGIKAGKVSLSTADAEQLLVVSTRPVVLGNTPDENEDLNNYETIAFLGQAPVWIVGKVQTGDYIIPSGRNDGYGLAISPNDLKIKHIPLILGKAWSDGEEAINLVNMIVGLRTNEMADILSTMDESITTLEARIQKIEDSLMH